LDDMASLLEAQVPGLRRYAWALLRNHAAADDLVHETLELAIARWQTHRANGQMRGWLYGIERSLFLAATRRQRAAGVASDNGRADASGPNDITVELRHLPEIERSALLLVGVERLSYEEAAGVLEIPVAEVLANVARARSRLRNATRNGGSGYPRRVK
jgi:DNA-directed RNA polymerase specialized sigma24 family protein